MTAYTRATAAQPEQNAYERGVVAIRWPGRRKGKWEFADVNDTVPAHVLADPELQELVVYQKPQPVKQHSGNPASTERVTPEMWESLDKANAQVGESAARRAERRARLDQVSTATIKESLQVADPKLDVEAERRKFREVVRNLYERHMGPDWEIMLDRPQGGDFAFKVWLAARTAATSTQDAREPGRGPRYTCIGKGGDYELIGEARGAGSMKLSGNMAVYRDTVSGALYYRATHDFNSRMAPSPHSPMGAKEQDK